MKKILVLLVMAALLMTSSLAFAQEPEIVEMAATVNGGGSPPVIEEMFVLERFDDIDDYYYDESGDFLHLTEGTQILPALGIGDQEVETDFYKFVVVSDPNGKDDIVTVYEKLFYPSGGMLGVESECTDITNTEDQDKALLGAWYAGLISEEQYDYLTWMLDPQKNQAKMFVIRNVIDSCDPNGEYEVYFKPVDGNGLYIEDSVFFDVLPTKGIDLDFTNINYGDIIVGVEKWIAGDEDWSTPDKPTIKNIGNEPLQIMIRASDLVGQEIPIQYIDAEYLSVELKGEHVTGLQDWVYLQEYLMPCTPTQICFDINAPRGTSANIYSGDIFIEVAPEITEETVVEAVAEA